MGLSRYKYQKLKKLIIENRGIQWVIDLTQDDNSSNTAPNNNNYDSSWDNLESDDDEILF